MYARKHPSVLLLLICLSLAYLFGAAAAMETNRKKDAPPANEVEMPFLIAPTNRNDTLIGFHYISYRLVTKSPEIAARVREKLAILQDAYVRSVYKAQIARANDPKSIDEPRLSKRLISIADGIVGNGSITGLKFTDIKFAPLHPKPGSGIFEQGAHKPAVTSQPEN